MLRLKSLEEKEALMTRMERSVFDPSDYTVVEYNGGKDHTRLPTGIIHPTKRESLLLWITNTNEDKGDLHMRLVDLDNFDDVFVTLTGRYPISSLYKDLSRATKALKYAPHPPLTLNRMSLQKYTFDQSIRLSTHRLVKLRNKRFFSTYADLDDNTKKIVDVAVEKSSTEDSEYPPLGICYKKIKKHPLFLYDYEEEGVLVTQWISMIVQELIEQTGDVPYSIKKFFPKSRVYHQYQAYFPKELRLPYYHTAIVFQNMLYHEMYTCNRFRANPLPTYIMPLNTWREIYSNTLFNWYRHFKITFRDLPPNSNFARSRRVLSERDATRKLYKLSGNLLKIYHDDIVWKMIFVTGSSVPLCCQGWENESEYLDSDIDIGVHPERVQSILGLDIKDNIAPFARWFREHLQSLHGIELEITPRTSTKCRLVKEGFRPLELFIQREQCVFNFHVAPVRGWFDGLHWYILPSAWLALKYGVSIDFRYSKSEKTAVAIVEKYWKRGYYIVLNDLEYDHIRTVIPAKAIKKYAQTWLYGPKS